MLPPMFNTPLLPTVNDCPPLNCPEDQLSTPLTARPPAPASLVPLTFKIPLAPTMLAFASVSVFPPMAKIWLPLFPPSVRLETVALALRVTVYVPLAMMSTASAELGTWFGLQLVGVLQSPLPPVHVTVAARS